MGRTQLQDAIFDDAWSKFRAFSILLKEGVKSIRRTAEAAAGSQPWRNGNRRQSERAERIFRWR